MTTSWLFSVTTPWYQQDTISGNSISCHLDETTLGLRSFSTELCVAFFILLNPQKTYTDSCSSLLFFALQLAWKDLDRFSDFILRQVSVNVS